MKTALQPRWLFLYFLVFIVSAGAFGLSYFSTPTNAKIRLKPGERASLIAFRLRPQSIEPSLFFDRIYGKNRPELGHLDSEILVSNGNIVLREPGTPVKLSTEVNSVRTVFEALPSQGADMEHWRRILVPFVDDGDPKRVPWPPNTALTPVIEPGFTRISASVTEVGQGIENEIVLLSLMPPIRHSRAEPGYEIFLWFRYSNIYWVLLGVYALFASYKPSSTKNPIKSN